jgi:GNAT superfamily N-acetyltransferase
VAGPVSTSAVSDPAEVRLVIDGLVGFNTAQAGREGGRRLAVFVRDADNAVIGGVVGHTQWNWLFVSHLWLSQELRGRGLGRELMGAIEARATEGGCDASHLDTYDFGALPFYVHRGYRIFGSLPDFPTGHTRSFLWKRLGLDLC